MADSPANEPTIAERLKDTSQIIGLPIVSILPYINLVTACRNVLGVKARHAR
jgi:hypothetical protein